MPQQEQRRPIRPMQVLDRQKHGVAPTGIRQQVGDSRVEVVAFAVRIPRGGGRQLTHSLRKVRKQPRKLAAPRCQIAAQHIGVALAHELLQCGHERLVRRADDGVARAVEDERAVGGHVLRQLVHQPALSGPGFAGEQRDPPAVVLGSWKERPQRREFASAPDEGKRRRQAERTRKSRRVRRGHSQI
jgi:hypothetical protein